MTDEERNQIEKKAKLHGLLQFRGYNPKNPDHLLNSLKETKLIFGDRKNFNDPFDCNLPIDTDCDLSEIQILVTEANFAKNSYDLAHISSHSRHLFSNKQELKTKIEDLIYNYRRFSCFTIGSRSKQLTNTLFWSNYANKHKGVCLKFNWNLRNTIESNTNNNLNFIPIEYCRTEEIPKFNYIKNRAKGRPELAVQYFFGIKSREWAYEEEIRLLIYSMTKFEKDYVYVSYSPADLEEIYLGCKLEKDEKDAILGSLKDSQYKHLRIFELKLDTKSFRLIPKAIN